MTRTLAFVLTLWPMLASAALAQDDGIPVTVEVLGVEGEVIPTAVVRHPDEKEQHKVNTETGRWTERVLYMTDGSEFIFTKGEILAFEVSAPGYKNETVTYVVRKRKNLISVRLDKLNLDLSEDQEQSPNINFGRDKPLDK